jgi:hypothetical protein
MILWERRLALFNVVFYRTADRGETPLPQKLLIFDELAKNRKIPLFVIPVKPVT